MMTLVTNLVQLCLEAAPWLVLGLILSGLIKVLIPVEFLYRHLGQNNLTAIVKAAMLGAPLPLCSCSVIPVALGLRQAGASKAATTSFLVSTPETGVDSVGITYVLMGPVMTIARPLAALGSALVAGILVSIFDREDAQPQTTPDVALSPCCDAQARCSSSIKQAPIAAAPKYEHAEQLSISSTQQPFMAKVYSGVHYAFTQLLDDILLYLIVGIIFAALVKTYLPPSFLTQWGQGIVAMLVVMLVGIPTYICATASTPVAAGLMLAGLSPGAALVFMLTGPASNIATLGAIQKSMGRRAMVLYLLGVCCSALLAGLVLDALVKKYNLDLMAQLSQRMQHNGLLEWASLFLLTALAAYNIWLKYRKR